MWVSWDLPALLLGTAPSRSTRMTASTLSVDGGGPDKSEATAALTLTLDIIKMTHSHLIGHQAAAGTWQP